MARLSSGHDYYRKMLDLQEKLRKSEEERIRLEERFKILVQESRSRHDACINRLRLRYIEFLEEQRARDERNHKLLGTLDRVDSSLALITAKTDRLNVLRKQYEASLTRAYANRNPGSVTGDSGIASQNEDRWSRRNISIRQVHSASPDTKSVSSSQIIRNNLPSEQSISSGVKLNPSISRNLVDSGSLMTQSDTILQRGLWGCGVLPYTSSAARPNLQKYSFPQDSSSYAHRNAYASPARIREAANQHGASGAATLVEAAPLSHRSVPRNVSQPVQMEPVQTAAHFSLPETANADVSLYKLPDTSASVPPAISVPIAQSAQFPRGKMLAANSRSTAGSTEFPLKTGLNGALVPGSLAERPWENYRGYQEYQEDPREIRRSFRELGVHSLTGAEIDEIMRRNDRPEDRTPRRSLQNFAPCLRTSINGANEDEASANLESQLDRYIHKMRMTQREHDIRSFEEGEHEQNTSGDLLNASLTDDDLDLPAEAKQKEQLPEEVERVLALADDLASRTVLEDVAPEENQPGKEASMENIEPPEDTENQESNGIRNDGVPDQQEPIESLDLAKDEIRTTELDNSRPARDEIAGSMFEVSKDELPLKIEDEGVLHRSKGSEENEVARTLYSGEESELELHSIQDLEELESFDLKRIEKRVEELELNDTDKDQSTEKDIVTEESTVHDSSEEQLGVLDLLDSVPKKLGQDEIQAPTAAANEKSAPQEIGQSNDLDTKNFEGRTPTSDVEPKLENDVQRLDDSPNEIEPENSNDDHSGDTKPKSLPEESPTGEIQQNDEPEPSQPNIDGDNGNLQQTNDNNQEQYAEVPNETQEYPQDYDYNNQYESNVDQTYQEYENQQYVEGTNDQYADYANQQYDQYEQDPNAQYQDYNYDQQYDPNQTYQTDPNQAYEYSENAPYDVNTENAPADQSEAQNDPANETFPDEMQGDTKNPSEVVHQTQEENPDEEESRAQETPQETSIPKKKKDVIKSLLDSDTDSTIERNVTNTESDFDFN